MPPLKSGDLRQLKPYIALGEMLGKIYYQAEKETVEKVAGQDEQLAGTAGEPTGPAVEAESFAEDHLPLPLRPS